jgi:hypothetical protein
VGWEVGCSFTPVLYKQSTIPVQTLDNRVEYWHSLDRT